MKWLKYVFFNYFNYCFLMKIQYFFLEIYDCNLSIGCKLMVDVFVFYGVSLEGGGIDVMVLVIMVIGYCILVYCVL